jgi:hypothetical protein
MRKYTLPSRDMKGNGPVRSLYNVPVILSMNAAKQNMFASKDVLSSLIRLALGGHTTLLMELSRERTSMSVGGRLALMGSGPALALIGACAMMHRVLCIPILGRFMWPLAIAGLGLRYLVTPTTVRFGHPLRKPRRIAFRSVEMRGLHNNWCANQMLFTLFCTVWVKQAKFSAWALATTGAANNVMVLP